MSLISDQSESFAFDYWPIKSIPSPQEERSMERKLGGLKDDAGKIVVVLHPESRLFIYQICTVLQCNPKNKLLCIKWSREFCSSVCLATTNLIVVIPLKLLKAEQEEVNQPWQYVRPPQKSQGALRFSEPGLLRRLPSGKLAAEKCWWSGEVFTSNFCLVYF